MIASRVAGIPDVLREGDNGLLVPEPLRVRGVELRHRGVVLGDQDARALEAHGLGLAGGRGSAADDHRPLYGRVARFIGEFERRLGATSCSGLLGCDISTGEILSSAAKIQKVTG